MGLLSLLRHVIPISTDKQAFPTISIFGNSNLFSEFVVMHRHLATIAKNMLDSTLFVNFAKPRES